jgi:hypothetical protein
MPDLVLANGEMVKGVSAPTAFGQLQTPSSTPISGVNVNMQFQAVLTPTAVLTDVVGLLGTNNQLLQRVITQFFPTSGLFVTASPIDPGLTWAIWSDDFLDFIAQTKMLYNTPLEGLSRNYAQVRIQTNQTAFTTQTFFSYTISGNTTNRNPIRLVTLNNSSDFQQNIVEFYFPMDISDSTIFSITSLPYNPAVGATQDFLTVTINIINLPSTGM